MTQNTLHSDNLYTELKVGQISLWNQSKETER